MCTVSGIHLLVFQFLSKTQCFSKHGHLPRIAYVCMEVTLEIWYDVVGAYPGVDMCPVYYDNHWGMFFIKLLNFTHIESNHYLNLFN